MSFKGKLPVRINRIISYTQKNIIADIAFQLGISDVTYSLGKYLNKNMEYICVNIMFSSVRCL